MQGSDFRLMLFTVIFTVLALATVAIVLLGVVALLSDALTAFRQSGWGQWLLGPFRSWVGMDETRD